MGIVRKPLTWVGAAILAAAALTVYLLLAAGEARTDPPSTSSSSSTSSASDPLSSSLSCAEGESLLTEADSLRDVPGGHLTPAAAMEGYLQQFGQGIGLVDVQRVIVVGNTNTEYARYKYINPTGKTILLFELNVVGDSWHVTGWVGCADQVEAVLNLDDDGPPPGISSSMGRT